MSRRHHALPQTQRTVNAITSQQVSRNVKLAELVGTYLESNQNPHRSNGGAFQINLAAHPGVTVAQTRDPVWSAAYMRSAYVAAVRKVGAAAFRADPEHAAERAAYLAEKPAKEYHVAQSAARVHEAFLAASAELGAGAPGANPNLPLSGGKPILASGNVTDASKAAARKLYDAGIRGRTLVISLSIVGAMTKGHYTPKVVDDFIASYHHEGGHLRRTIGASYYESTGTRRAAYLAYVGRSLSSLKAIGHETPFKIGSHDPGEKGSGGPSSIQEGTIKATEAFNSVKGLIGWFANVDHLIRVAFIILGIILIIVGLAKLSGATVPKVDV